LICGVGVAAGIAQVAIETTTLRRIVWVPFVLLSLCTAIAVSRNRRQRRP
jgi:hypothetical protein